MSFNFRSFVHFPIGFILLLSVGFLVCYGIAVNLSHVPPLPYWPYVSNNGVSPPESCIFTLILTWGAFFFLVTMFTHHRYVIQHGHSTKCNKAALIVGFIAGFGMTVVGAFQFSSAGTRIVHICGALAAFVGAIIYSWMLVYISWKYMSKSGYGKGIIYFRLIVAIVELVSLILLIVSTSVYAASPSLTGDAEVSLYNFSSASEWCLIYSAILFVGTLIYEMNNVRVAKTQLSLHTSSFSGAEETNRISRENFHQTENGEFFENPL